MGFFSKIWKGVKKTFKKIGRGIKKVFKKVGKFMNKIGIVGQIAMSFILPGIGGALAKTFGNVVGALSGGALGAVGKAAGWVLQKAGKFAELAYTGYKTVTGAITDFIGTTGKYVGGKLGIGENLSLSQAFGKEGWGGRLTDSFSKLGDAASEFWDTDIKGVLPDTSVNITKPQGPIMDETEELAGLRVEAKAAGDYNISDPYKGPSLESIEGKTSVDIGADIDYAAGIKTGSVVDSTVSSETTKAGQSLLSRGFEAITGEKDLAGLGSSMAKRTGEYLLDAPGKAVASTITTGLGQAAGVIAKPPGEPGPAWGGYASQFAAPTYAATQQALQPLSFGDYVQNFATGGEQQGSFLGQDFWQSYMQRSLAA